MLWATCRLVDVDALPDAGLVARIELTDRPRTDVETLAHWHLRHLSYRDAARSGRLDIQGSRGDVQAFLRCLRPSPFAGTQPASPTSL